MTDELSPEFLAFSELLDQEESLSSVSLDENARLLLALRNELREGRAQPPELPSHFAASTAAKVVRRWQAQSSVDVALVRLESWLRARLASWRGVAGGTGLLALLGFAFYEFSLVQLALSGVLLGVLALSLKGLYSWRLPGTFDVTSPSRLPEMNIPGLYYLLPVAAVWFTAMLAGRGVASLDQVSFSFRASTGILPLAGVATAAVTFFWLINGFIPFWKAAQQRPLLAQAVVWLNSAWLAFLGQLYFDSQKVPVIWNLRKLGAPESAFLGLFLVTALISVVVASKGAVQEKTPWKKTLKRCLSAFLVGVIPVGLALFLLLNFGLTKELRRERVYRDMVSDVESYVAAQRAIKPEQNGMTDLRPFFFRSQLDMVNAPDKSKVREAQAVADRLKKGSYLWRDNEPLKGKERERVRADFLKELPRIEKALSKPHFSILFGDEEFGYGLEVPNFILCRAISQGLSALMDESLTENDTEQALRYLETNLKWSKVVPNDTLISLMIATAQRNIALTDVERLIFEGKPTLGQLTRLQALLQQNEPHRDDLKHAMLRDTFGADKMLRDLVSGRSSRSDWANYGGDSDLTGLYTLIPVSYWESERLAYLNLQFDQLEDWEDLGSPSLGDLEEILAMNPIASQITPNYPRAQVQFMKTLTRFSALRIVVALERYQREHGGYPDKLEALVPAYLSELPKDAVHPNRWEFKPTFEYQKKGAKYELVSSSNLYPSIRLAPRQVYGPDGDYTEAKAAR